MIALNEALCARMANPYPEHCPFQEKQNTSSNDEHSSV